MKNDKSTSNRSAIVSDSQPSSSKSSKNNKALRKQFWDTVLDKPSNDMNTSPVSEYSDTAEASSWRLPTNATSVGKHSTVSYALPSTNILGSADREVESWAKGRKPRPFKCSICQSCYAQKGDMVRHVRCVHEGLRPFHCHICGSSFGRRSVLNKHVQRHLKKLEDEERGKKSRSSRDEGTR